MCGIDKAILLNTKTDDEFRIQLYNKHGDEYIPLEKYKKTNEKIAFKHKVCNKEFKTSPYVLLRGNCPVCNETRIESKIRRFLELNNILFEREYTFDDLKYKILLRFDYAITDANKNLKCLIEADGKQHYEPIEYFGGMEAYKKIVERDTLKNKYCIKNNIPLLRVPYYKIEDTESILKNFFKI